LRTMGHHVGRNLELYLMGFSVTMALAIPFAVEVGTNAQELAVTALFACVVQGMVFWLVRRRPRRARLQTITELRAMLQDRINNQLAIVLLSVSQRCGSPESANDREILEAAIAATGTVSRLLEELSAESLRSWKAKYGMDEIRSGMIPAVGEPVSRS
jgi:C4-dicarboxylate-specific signal transduction histidine kinase